MYYDPLLALSLCHCAKQQQQQQQQHNNGKSGHCYPFRWPSSAVASPTTTVTYPQLYRPPGSESSNWPADTCEHLTLPQPPPPPRPQPPLSSFSQSQPTLGGASVRANHYQHHQHPRHHLPQSGHPHPHHLQLYSPPSAVQQQCHRRPQSQLSSSSSSSSSSSLIVSLLNSPSALSEVAVALLLLPLLAPLLSCSLVAVVYCWPLCSLSFIALTFLLFLFCHSTLPSLLELFLLSALPFLPSTWTVQQRWWKRSTTTTTTTTTNQCARQLLESIAAGSASQPLYGQLNGSSHHLSPVPLSSQTTTTTPPPPLPELSSPSLLNSFARAISHFCTSVTRQNFCSTLLARSSGQSICHILLSFYFFAISSFYSTFSSLCHSLMMSDQEEVEVPAPEKPVALLSKKVLSSRHRHRSTMPTSSSASNHHRKQSTQPCRLWWYLSLALLALSEPLLVSGFSSGSSSSSSSSIYSSGSGASHMVAPMVYGLSNSNSNSNSNRRQQPKRNLHVNSGGGNGRSPGKQPAIFTFFEEKDSSVRFSHMVVNVFNGRIYVGGDNAIYQLKMNGSQQHLVLEERAVMGPAEDNPECPATKNCPPHVTKRLSNYYNKALIIDMAHSWLISCGSLYQGACAAHNWNNVSQVLHAPMESVVANNATASTVVFIAPGPPPHKHVLYVGATFTMGNYRSDVPAVSSRSLFENRKSSFSCHFLCRFFPPRCTFRVDEEQEENEKMRMMGMMMIKRKR